MKQSGLKIPRQIRSNGIRSELRKHEKVHTQKYLFVANHRLPQLKPESNKKGLSKYFRKKTSALKRNGEV